MADSSTLPGLRSWPQMPPEWWRFFRELSTTTTTATVDLSGCLPITTGVSGPMSVRAIGTLEAGFVTFQLVNDSSAPGNTRYYGTGPTGSKGFFPVADALAEGANITLTVGSDGITTIAAGARNAASALATSGSVAVDYALGDYFTLALAGNVTTFTFSNLPGSGKSATLMFRITQDATPRTVAWPASFKWEGGVAGAVSTTAGAVDVVAITTFDNGTSWQATIGKAFA